LNEFDAQPIDIHAPALRRLPIMSQRWENLSFLHWRVDPALVAPLLPAGTRPDVFDGSSWVGLIPFTMVRAGLGLKPPVPYFGTFAETNVRLYSVDSTGRRGVVFRSLETSRLAVVFGSRAAFGVPYMWARMRIAREGDDVVYTSTRRFPGPRGVGGRIVVRPGAPLADRDPLGDFLSARWGLHTRWAGRLMYVPNRHGVWPLHHAELRELDDSLVAAAGLPGLVGLPPDSVLWSPGVKTDFGMPFSVPG
jgi:uncharacterized protein YqjF (DUF2071 family)